MGRAEDDKWLDEALDNAIASHDTQPDFETWKANHPEAIQRLTSRAEPPAGRPPVIRRITMNSLLVKLAAAAVIAIAAIVGIMQLTGSAPDETGPDIIVAEALRGPMRYEFPDGSTVALAPGASIFPFTNPSIRGFEHATGTVDVTVAKGKGEFIVRTPYGEVKALGTQFTLDLVDGVAENTKEKVQLLSVEVTEGKVEVSNAKGSSVLGAAERLVVASNEKPYDFHQDAALPAGLKSRVGAMVAAFEAGDAAAWAANFNFDYVYKLAKGQVPYDPQRFGGSKEDADRLGQMAANIDSPEQLSQLFLGTVNITEPGQVYVRSVELSEAGDHAQAVCVQRKSENHMVITTPQWHHFDGDWWQIDD